MFHLAFAEPSVSALRVLASYKMHDCNLADFSTFSLAEFWLFDWRFYVFDNMAWNRSRNVLFTLHLCRLQVFAD